MKNRRRNRGMARSTVGTGLLLVGAVMGLSWSAWSAGPEAVIDYNAGTLGPVGSEPTAWVDSKGVGHEWKFRQNGGTVIDISGDPTRPAGINEAVEKADAFLGNLQHTTSAPSPIGGTGSFSVEVWFRPAETTGLRILWEDGGLQNGVSLLPEEGDVSFNNTVFNALFSARAPFGDTGKFHQVVGVLDVSAASGETGYRLYLDGEPAGVAGPRHNTDAWHGANVSTIGNFLVANLPNNAAGAAAPKVLSRLDADIARLRFYDVALTDEDVAAIFKAAVSGPGSGGPP
jgi:hypothetical protein